METNMALENSQGASIGEIKEVLQQIGLDREAVNSSNECIEPLTNIDDMLDKVVEAISQAFPSRIGSK